jgi:hypothetical protein
MISPTQSPVALSTTPNARERVMFCLNVQQRGDAGGCIIPLIRIYLVVGLVGLLCYFSCGFLYYSALQEGRYVGHFVFHSGSAVSSFSSTISLLATLSTDATDCVLVADVVVTGIGILPGQNRRGLAI